MKAPPGKKEGLFHLERQVETHDTFLYLCSYEDEHNVDDERE